jgi:hypothetical protein
MLDTSEPNVTTTFDDFKILFFADQTLEQIAVTLQGAKTEPWSLFAEALEKSQQGDKEAARSALHRISSNEALESRVRLLAWKSLRDLGESPPAEIANVVHGVICELHNESGVGTIAAYADRSARWLGGQGRVTIWDARDADSHVDALITGLMKSATSIATDTPAQETHQSPEPSLNYFRVTVLTFGGLHVAEVFGPEINEAHPLFSLLVGSVDLVEALTAKL